MTTKPIDVRAFAHALAHEFDSQRMTVQADAIRCAMQAASEGAARGPNDTSLATIAQLTEERDDANARAEAASQQTARMARVCDSFRAEVTELRARNIALESDLASRSAHVASLQRELAEARADRSLLRKKLALAAVEASPLSPIPPTSPLKVGDRVRLKDATVDSVSIGGETALATVHASRPGVGVENSQVRVFTSAIAGRVRA